jgi:hypothetical protein
MVEMRYAHNILAGKPEGKRPLGRSTRSWEDSEWVLGKEDGRLWTRDI